MLIAKNGNISIREFEETDIHDKIYWINNAENNRYLHYDIPLNYEKTREWFLNKDNSRRLDCTIEYCGVSVGLIGLLAIDLINRKAEFYICVGETVYKQRGIATEASRLIIDYAFSELKLHKVYLNTDAENTIAHKLFEKVGFIREGYFIDDMIHRGKYIDRIRYAIINMR